MAVAVLVPSAFVKREVPKIEASPAFGSNGLVVIVFDEATASTLYHDGGPVLWAAQGPQVQPGVYGGAFTQLQLPAHARGRVPVGRLPRLRGRGAADQHDLEVIESTT